MFTFKKDSVEPVSKNRIWRATIWVVATCAVLALPQPASALCNIPWYVTDSDDLIRIKGKLYDNVGNETKVDCTFANPDNGYRAWTGGSATPPGRNIYTAYENCPVLDPELSDSTGASGADVPIYKNGTPTNACAFVGQRNVGSGWPYGYYISSVLKFDPVKGFKSEKGTLIYNLTSGSFIGKFSVIAK